MRLARVVTMSLPLPSGESTRSSGRPLVPGYRVGPLLGIGATAEVWSATRLDDGEQYAVKVIGRQRLSGDGEGDLEPDVRRELAVLRGLRHPHVVQLIDDLVLADGRTVLVLELAAGGSLARIVQARGHLTPGETVTVLTTLAATLADLHRLGVTHGDLSPGNVLFHLDGRPMLTDVGRAGIAGRADDRSGGTSGFVDPARPAGAPADVYAVGALGWFALTGAAPALAAVRPALATLAPGTPDELAAVIGAALDPDPGRRSTAAELARAAHQAGPSAPVRLAGDRDPADLLTHRIREWAATEPLVAAGPSGRGSWAPWRRVRARHWPGTRLAGGRLRITGTAVAASGCVVATLLATAAPAAAPSSAPAAARGAVDTSASHRPAWPVLVAALTDARAEAFSRPDGGPASFDQPGSTAWRADQGALDRLRRAGLHYRGLRIEPDPDRSSGRGIEPGRAPGRLPHLGVRRGGRLRRGGRAPLRVSRDDRAADPGAQRDRLAGVGHRA